jgi:hypothetical protein
MCIVRIFYEERWCPQVLRDSNTVFDAQRQVDDGAVTSLFCRDVAASGAGA